MPSVNGNTGKLFTPAEGAAGEDLKQSVEDRILRPLGSRPHLPDYGSLVTVQVPYPSEVSHSVITSLFGDPRVKNVELRAEGRRLHIIVHGDFE